MTGPDRQALWRWALWFGAVTGLAQACLVAGARATTHRLILISPDVVWMAPAADVAVFTAAAVGLQLGTQRLKRSSAVWLALSVFFFLFLLGPSVLIPRLHLYAAIILAAGAAAQGGRMLAPRAEVFDVVARRTLPGLAALVAALGFGLHVERALAARRAERSVVHASPGAVNVILIVLDTVRAQNLTLYGYTRNTSPRLTAFADGGTVFDRAFSTSPWTLPSHGSMFTGRLPHALSADWLTPLDGAHRTLAEAFADAGYTTAGFVGNLLYTTGETGLSRGFARYRDYPLSVRSAVNTSWLARFLSWPLRTWVGDPERLVRKSAADVNNEFFAWLESRPAKPFFAFLNYFDAHSPYNPPGRFATLFGDGGPQADVAVRRDWSALKIQRSMDAYDGALAYLDLQFGHVLDTLTTKGLIENTVVVVTSDHGEQFGEHGLFDHGNSLYRQVLQVPLVIAHARRIPHGLRIAEAVSLVDLPATILDLAQIGDDRNRFPGDSLTRYWDGRQRPAGGEVALLAEISKAINMAAWLPASKGPMKSVMTREMHYIRHSDGREELYDVNGDLAEREDLSTRADARVALERSRRALDALLSDGARAAAAKPSFTRHSRGQADGTGLRRSGQF